MIPGVAFAAVRKLYLCAAAPPWLRRQAALSNSPVLRCGMRRGILAQSGCRGQHGSSQRQN
jgi:hypothetical protein